LVYAGTLADNADSVFVRVFADDQLFATETAKLTADKKYALSAKLNLGLIKYRTEFGSKTGDKETVLHTAKNIVCGDAFLIIGQSNAVANDFGKDNPLVPSEWVRTFGATAGDPNGSRLKLWANAKARSPGGRSGRRRIACSCRRRRRCSPVSRMATCMIDSFSPVFA